MAPASVPAGVFPELAKRLAGLRHLLNYDEPPERLNIEQVVHALVGRARRQVADVVLTTVAAADPDVCPFGCGQRTEACQSSAGLRRRFRSATASRVTGVNGEVAARELRAVMCKHELDTFAVPVDDVAVVLRVLER